MIQRKPYDGDDLVQNTLLLARRPEFASTIASGKNILLNSSYLNELPSRQLSDFIAYLDKTRLDADDRKFMAIDIVSLICGMIFPSLFGSLSSPAHYLPADRTGVMHAHSVVVSALIASAPAGGLRSTGTMPTLSGVLADFLNDLIKIDQVKRVER